MGRPKRCLWVTVSTAGLALLAVLYKPRSSVQSLQVNPILRRAIEAETGTSDQRHYLWATMMGKSSNVQIQIQPNLRIQIQIYCFKKAQIQSKSNPEILMSVPILYSWNFKLGRAQIKNQRHSPLFKCHMWPGFIYSPAHFSFLFFFNNFW